MRRVLQPGESEIASGAAVLVCTGFGVNFILPASTAVGMVTKGQAFVVVPPRPKPEAGQ